MGIAEKVAGVQDAVHAWGFDAGFNNYAFILLFLPIVLAGYWAVPGRRWKLGWLVAMSLLFYSFWDVRFVWLLVLASLLDFVIALRMSRLPEKRDRRRWLVASIVLNLATLAFFKYAMFAADNLRSIFGVLGVPVELPYFYIVLPVGISFYTFQTMSYTIDVYRGEVPASRDFLKFLAFVTLFPQLVAGPIIRYRDLSGQLDDLPRRPTQALLAMGVAFFAIGLFKKMAIADTVASLTAPYWADTSGLTMMEAWMAALGYTIQLYFDFSGYSDMALGLGALLGFRFPFNFRAPYQALNPSDFWRRWHVSLSSFLRDYLYIPLGGNRKGPTRAQVNMLLVMLLGGLWHGAAWTFVLWGLYHGLLLAAYSRVKDPWDRMPVLLQRVATLLLVVVGWVMFRATSLGQAFDVYAAMVDVSTFRLGALASPVLLGLVAILAFAMVARPLADWGRREESVLYTARGGAAVAGLMVAALVLLSIGSSPFLYYQF